MQYHSRVSPGYGLLLFVAGILASIAFGIIWSRRDIGALRSFRFLRLIIASLAISVYGFCMMLPKPPSAEEKQGPTVSRGNPAGALKMSADHPSVAKLQVSVANISEVVAKAKIDVYYSDSEDYMTRPPEFSKEADSSGSAEFELVNAQRPIHLVATAPGLHGELDRKPIDATYLSTTIQVTSTQADTAPAPAPTDNAPPVTFRTGPQTQAPPDQQPAPNPTPSNPTDNPPPSGDPQTPPPPQPDPTPTNPPSSSGG